MKKLILKTLYKLGYEVVKTNGVSAKIIKSKSPIYIEFIGVPGVGKTTLYQECQKTRVFWIDKKLILQDVKKEFLQKIKKRIVEDIDTSLYNKLSVSKIENISKQDYPGTDKLNLLAYFSRIISEDITINTNNQYVIGAEEGIIHNFGNELLQLLTENSEVKKNSFFQNRVIVHCYAEASVIADRVLKREKEQGTLLPQYKVTSKEKLIEVIENTLLSKKKLVGKLLEIEGINVINIDTNDDLLGNATKVNTSIQKILGKN